jgi:transcriptional regulator with XRE-family HTH domain
MGRMGRPPRAAPADRPPVARRITQAREKAGLTQEGLGKLISKAQATIGGWEKGTHKPQLADLEAIARATHVNVDWLAFGRDGREPPDSDSLVELIAEAEEKYRHFAWALDQASRIFSEEGLRMKISHRVGYVLEILADIEGQGVHGDAKQAISRKMEADRVQLRSHLDKFRKSGS